MERAVNSLSKDLKLEGIRSILKKRQKEKSAYLKPEIKPIHRIGYVIMFLIGLVFLSAPFCLIAFIGLVGMPGGGIVIFISSIAFAIMIPQWMGNVALPPEKQGDYKHRDSICPYCYKGQVTTDLSLYWKCGYCGEEIVRFHREIWKLMDIMWEEDFLLNCARYKLTGGGEL